MFSYISGKKISYGGGSAVIDVNGVGFCLSISDGTAGRLAADKGDSATLYTYLSVREDALELFGFYDTAELDTFKMLISVSGIGPKVALSVLSTLSPERFAIAVLSDDAKSISASQGVGLKTAQKIILELKDKIAKNKTVLSGNVSRKAFAETAEPAGVNADASLLGEAINALVVLGYSRTDAASALGRVEGDMPLEKLIKEGLKRLNSDK